MSAGTDAAARLTLRHTESGVPYVRPSLGVPDPATGRPMRVYRSFPGMTDEQAMAAALGDGHIARYVTDFPNPISADMKNAIVLPHLGASTTEAEENCAVMAAEELRDFIENGNITHSVNFGAVDLGPIASGERLAIIHQNVQGMIGKFSQYLADSGINIENMANKSRGTMAYTLIDIAGEVPADVIDHLSQAEGVRRIRVILAK